MRYRKRGDELPVQTRYNLPMEFLYTIAPILIVSVLFYYTAIVQTDVDKLSKNPDVTVEVVAFKWNWQFNYRDGQGPDANTVASTLGTSEVIPVLVLPTDRSIRFEETSRDVIHSFWVPELLFKRDVFPGKIRNVFEVSSWTRRARTSAAAPSCAARYHAFMNFELRVVSPEKYDQFLAAKQAGKSTQDALAAIGEDSRTRRPRSRSTPGGRRATSTRTARPPAREAEAAGMKTEWRIFADHRRRSSSARPSCTAPGRTATAGHVEWVGTVALLLSVLLCSMCGGFFWFVSRRIDLRPEDRPDGEIADGAGEVGFFSPGSYWPFGLALAAATAGLGLVFWQFWLIGARPGGGHLRRLRPALRVLHRHPAHRRALIHPVAAATDPYRHEGPSPMGAGLRSCPVRGGPGRAAPTFGPGHRPPARCPRPVSGFPRPRRVIDSTSAMCGCRHGTTPPPRDLEWIETLRGRGRPCRAAPGRGLRRRGGGWAGGAGGRPGG